MVTLEIDLDETHSRLYEQLREQYGPDAVDGDIQALIGRSLYESVYGAGGA